MEMKDAKSATLCIGDKEITFPVIVGTEGEVAIDIRKLRAETGLITFDPGYVNTGSCRSEITYLDGEKGILMYRGYPIEDLVEHCEFVEVAYLLVHGKLPNVEERQHFSDLLNRHSLIHEDMLTFFRSYTEHAHPMAILSAMVVSLSTFYPEVETAEGQEELDMTVTRLLAKIRTIAAYSYRKVIGHPFVNPSHKLLFCENFLNMMFSSPVVDYKIDPVLVKALNQLLILHADHEQNCSTSAVRLVGSAGANLYASVSAGICALWGPLHGGANQKVIDMLIRIEKDGGGINKAIERAKNKNSNFRLMGFGHRVYKTYDPRAKVAKAICDKVLKHLGVKDKLLDIALELEAVALNDEYFIERNLYPNVDFYTGIVFRAMGIPTDMFTVMFAIGRLPGWIAQWLEWQHDPANRIGRPRQVYTGPQVRKVQPMAKRK
ncbi:MAG: citrate synthase [Spartobacteria bacterium]|nr:citrate synthase [Spartobacteria bacterium]